VTTYTEHELRQALNQEAASALTPPTDAILHGFRARLVRRQRTQAMVASASVLVAAAIALDLAVGSSTAPNRVGPLAPVMYQQACAVEPDACLPGTKGTVPPTLSRPLALPSLAAGARCPATRGRMSTSTYVRGQEYGSGPVRLVLGDRGDPSRGIVALGEPDRSPWLAAENVLLINPSYRGPVLLRGQRLDRPGTAFFDGDEVISYLDPPYPDANTQKDGSRTPPASIFVRSPGCYGFQIDGTDFTTTIVLDMTAPRTGQS
jgi:hypothetical protein